MLRGTTFWKQVLSCAVCVCLVGCGQWGDSAEESVEEADAFTEATETSPAGNGTLPSNTAGAPAAAVARAPERPRSVPLVKTVIQQLRQNTPDGWVNSRSILELTMTISPDDATGSSTNGQISYRVKYHRVRLLQEVPDQPQLSYDSDTAFASVPPAARPYQGLKDNGFQFRLNREHQLTEVAGLEPFLDRCLLTVPPELRRQFHAGLPLNAPAEVIAYFIDDSIGLIPPAVSQAGDSWLRTREILQPVPVVLTTRCTIRQMTAETAEVDMSGTLGPVTDRAAADSTSDGAVRMTVRGGQLLGKCRMDRRTGLPAQSRVEQSIDMLVHLADGTELEQFKTTVTTLETRTGEATPFPPPSTAARNEAGISPR